MEAISHSTMSPNDSTVEAITRPPGATEVAEKDVQTKLFRLYWTNIKQPSENAPEGKHTYHHDINNGNSYSN